jgi:GTPase SAR1 family protein
MGAQVGVLGPAGAGKSSLLSSFYGMLDQDQPIFRPQGEEELLSGMHATCGIDVAVTASEAPSVS